MQVGKPVRLNAHFDDMLNAFITVFVIITCDNWTDIMYPMMSVSVPFGKRRLLHLYMYPMMSVSVMRV